jgi:diguanylate cyclase (GGDEF)-like protein
MSTGTSDPSVGQRDERHAMGRIGAAIAAAIALFGAIASIGPLSSSGIDVGAMRTIVASAAVIAGLILIVPWQRLPRSAFNLPLLFMTMSIGALAEAADTAGSSMLVLLAFVVVLSAYYLPRKWAIVQLAFVAIVLATRIVSLDNSGSRHAEALRVTLLMAALVALFALVLVMRNAITKREALIKNQDVFDYQTGLLTRSELDRVLAIELSRAQRHARPLSVVMMDLSGPVFEDSGPSHVARVLTLVARSVLGRIRVEDSAARLDGLRFAIVAPETSLDGAVPFSEMVAEVVRRRLVTLGYDNHGFSIAYSWAEYPHHGQSPDELLKVAEIGLEQGELRHESAPAAQPRGVLPQQTPAVAPQAQ